jgi:hypothetical protein
MIGMKAPLIGLSDGFDQPESLFFHVLRLPAKQGIGAGMIWVAVEVHWFYAQGLSEGRQYVCIEEHPT